MRTMCENWGEVQTKFGTLIIQKPELGVSVNEIGEEIKLKSISENGEVLRWNDNASTFFGMPIYGGCFLKPVLEKMPELVVLLVMKR